MYDPLTLTIFAVAFAALELATGAGASRRLFSLVTRVFIFVELGAMRLLRIVAPPRYEVLGSCHKCGECCKQIVGNPPRFVKNSRLLDLFAAYHKVMHNFEAVARGPNDEVIFSCGHLLPSGRCGIYKRRPFICRNYPLRPYFEAPPILPYCGYQMAPRRVAKMKRRRTLPILNPGVTVHHPTRLVPGEDMPENFEWLDDTLEDA